MRHARWIRMRMKWEKNSKKTPSMQRCVGGWSNETTQLGTDKRPNALKHGLQGEGRLLKPLVTVELPLCSGRFLYSQFNCIKNQFTVIPCAHSICNDASIIQIQNS